MFVSIHFLFFLVATLIFFYCSGGAWRTVVLLMASLGFCFVIDTKSFVVLILLIVVVYSGAIALERLRQAERQRGETFLFWAMILGCLWLFSWHPGIGTSFYLFQAIAYLTDVKKEKSRAEKNLIFLALYFAFFAKFISGPIERVEDFIPQLRKLNEVRFLNRGRLSLALSYLLWGGFMKMVVADRLSQPIEAIFSAPEVFDSLQLVLGMLGYTIQVYCDFAGYSYMVVGIALLFGIRLKLNFNMPYTADSISDFWRRWHISLSNWLRDYVYIPLGGNRYGVFRKCMNSMIVFAVCGIWHGRSFRFLFWGLLHGSYLVVDTLWKTRIQKKVPKAVGRIVTFGAVAFAWIFFRVSGLRTGIVYVVTMLTAGIQTDKWQEFLQIISLSYLDIALIVLGFAVICFLDFLCRKKGEHLPELIQHQQNHIRYIIYYVFFVIIFLFGVYGPGYHGADFIYMQF